MGFQTDTYSQLTLKTDLVCTLYNRDYGQRSKVQLSVGSQILLGPFLINHALLSAIYRICLTLVRDLLYGRSRMPSSA